MNFNDFEKEFYMELSKNNIKEINNLKCFYDYMKLLLEWNEKINLTAITDEKEFIVKHFIDSLSIGKYLSSNIKLIDVGTGAGFPGLPLKLYDSSINVTLIDSVNKKINVLNDIIDKLKLKDVEAIHTRAEDFAKEKRESYDVAVSRAVANMSTLVEYLIPFVKIGGLIICMKGPNYEEELNNAKKAIEKLGGKIEKVESLIIDGELERNIIIIKKVGNTPKEFPRINGKALREPIK